MSTFDFYDDPAAFLDAAGGHLAVDPVVASVVATVTDRELRAPSPPQHPRWWVVVRDRHGRIEGVGMRTAPQPPHPLFLLPMPPAAAVELARRLHERGESVPGGRYGVNGALEPARACAGELAALTGGVAAEAMHTRLFELTDPAAAVLGAAVAGTMRRAGPGDADLVLAWFDDFAVAADAQAGRAVGGHPRVASTRDDVLRRIDGGEVWLWRDTTGRPVHLTAASAPQFGVSRIGPVYTPVRHRGHGYATTTVAAVTRRLSDAGARVCLFTDQANPTSNAIYARIGFTPVVDMVNLFVAPPGDG